jgi:hypothetical protein
MKTLSSRYQGRGRPKLTDYDYKDSNHITITSARVGNSYMYVGLEEDIDVPTFYKRAKVGMDTAEEDSFRESTVRKLDYFQAIFITLILIGLVVSALMK